MVGCSFVPSVFIQWVPYGATQLHEYAQGPAHKLVAALAASRPEGSFCTHDAVQPWTCLHQCLHLMPMHLASISCSTVELLPAS